MITPFTTATAVNGLGPSGKRARLHASDGAKEAAFGWSDAQSNDNGVYRMEHYETGGHANT